MYSCTHCTKTSKPHFSPNCDPPLQSVDTVLVKLQFWLFRKETERALFWTLISSECLQRNENDRCLDRCSLSESVIIKTKQRAIRMKIKQAQCLKQFDSTALFTVIDCTRNPRQQGTWFLILSWSRGLAGRNFVMHWPSDISEIFFSLSGPLNILSADF